jgi:hypothetical protein
MYFYFAEAKSEESGIRTHGALVAGVVSFRRRPGIKKVAGETVVPAEMPPQPPVKNASGSNSIANQVNFQFNLTS